jgi:hypothetical protein
VKSYRFGERLTPRSWNETLKSGPLTQSGWHAGVQGGLVFDLSKVRFADFAALAELLLLADRAVTDGIAVELRPPSERPTIGELQYAGSLGVTQRNAEHVRLAKLSRKRSDAKSFMRHAGFFDALASSHWPAGACNLVEHAQAESAVEQAAGRAPVDPSQPSFGNIFPFRWLDSSEALSLGAIEDELAVVLGLQRAVGLSRADAQALGRTVLKELVDNVMEHAVRDGKTPRALVGAVLLSGTTFRTRASNLHPRLEPFADRVASSRSDIVRLVVGDSGIGLASRLGPVKAALKVRSGVEAGGAGDLSPDEDTAFFAFDRWSTSRVAPASPEQGTRGLSTVQRVVQGYGGSVSIRTAKAHVVRTLLDPGQPSHLVLSDRYRAPGTLVEVAVLPTFTELGESAGLARAVGTSGALSLDTVWMDDAIAGEPAKFDLSPVWRAAAAAATSPTQAGTIVVVTSQVFQSERALAVMRRHLLALSRCAASGTTLAVVFPDANARELATAVSAMNDVLDAHSDGADSSADPMLVLDSRGEWRWFGGSPASRALFEHLSRSASSVAVDDPLLVGASAGSGVEPAVFIRQRFKVLAKTGNRISLLITPGDVVKSVIQAARDVLQAALSSGVNGPGVRVGKFLSPTLAGVSRWIDVEILLRASIPAAAAGFCLARSLEFELERQLGRSVQLLRSVGAPAQLAQLTAANLNLHSRPRELPESHRDRPIDASVTDLGEGEAILMTDLISTETSIRGAITTAAKGGTDLLAVLTVVDARDQRGPIVTTDGEIPVVSLARVDLSLENREGVVPIDPILRRPTSSVSWQTATRLPSDTFHDWCAQTQRSLVVGHVQGRSGSHFSVYPDLDSLLNNPRVGPAIVREFRDAVLVPPGSLEIWYPAPTEDHAGTIARRVAALLSEDGYNIHAVRPVVRASAGGRWIYASKEDLVHKDVPVLVLDWGAVTATSVQQMIRLAAGAGASRVQALVLLSEMSQSDRDTLQMLSQLRAKHLDSLPTLDLGLDAPILKAQKVELDISFITAAAFQRFDATNCPTCGLVKKYARHSSSGSRRVRDHATSMAERLAARPFDDPACQGKGLLGGLISSEEATSYLRWRSLLAESEFDTLARVEVVKRLEEAAKQATSEWSGTALIRLIAAEGQWLSRPPMTLEVARRLLGRYCMQAVSASAPVRTAIDDTVRQQALLVMADAAPDMFVERTGDLAEAVKDEPILLTELVTQLDWIVRHSERDPWLRMDRVAAGLNALREVVNADSQREREFSTAIYSLDLAVKRRESGRPQEAQAAWQRLKRDLVAEVQAHNQEPKWLNVQGVLADMMTYGPSAVPARSKTLLLKEFDSCGFALNQVLECLPALREIVDSPFYLRALGPRQQQWLLALCEEEAESPISEMRDDVRDLLEIDGGTAQGRVSDVIERFTELYAFFFSTHRSESDARRAEFVEQVADVPAYVRASLAEHLEPYGSKLHARGLIETSELQVFCPQSLLDEFVEHVRRNALRRAINDEADRVEFAVEATRGRNGLVTITVYNSHTGPRQDDGISPGGRGLNNLNRHFSGFGGEVWGEAMTGDWSFAVHLELPIWTEAPNE